MEHLHSAGSFDLIVWSVDVTSLMSTGETRLFSEFTFCKAKFVIWEAEHIFRFTVYKQSMPAGERDDENSFFKIFWLPGAWMRLFVFQCMVRAFAFESRTSELICFVKCLTFTHGCSSG